jgi:hypothetical protein
MFRPRNEMALRAFFLSPIRAISGSGVPMGWDALGPRAPQRSPADEIVQRRPPNNPRGLVLEVRVMVEVRDKNQPAQGKGW